MRKGIVLGIGMAALLAMGAMLQLTRPSEVGPLGVLAFFILAYVVSGSVAYLMLDGLWHVLRRTLPQGKLLITVQSMRRSKIYYYASVIALAPVVLIGMQSIGTVGAVEIILLITFEVLGCFYISRRF